ncbi:MAG: hypothetical protein ACK42E_04185, partial [Candidatus Bipolaricaulaceae bacterium]
GGSTVLALPYPEEYAELGPDLAVLSGIARLTGGVVLEDEEIPAAEGLEHDWLGLWRFLLWGGAAAFVLDLALRKLLAI